MYNILRIDQCIVLVFLCTVLPSFLFATHNRAGQITYVQKGNYTIYVTVTTYTKASSVQADRDSVLIDWGDGNSYMIPRTNGDGILIGNNTKHNTYEAEYTYPGPSTYTISVQDPNRVSNILNVNNSNSENIEFYIETTFTFTNASFDGPNNSVVLLQSPIDIACVGKTFKHIPNPFDKDGDSISFELITPLQANGIEVPEFVMPNEIIPGANNNITFDVNTGKIVWDSPQKGGEYNIAFRVNEYRNGKKISSMIRDMQIFVIDCDNNPPKIDVIEEICVVAGKSIELDVMVSDPDSGQKVKLEATGAPFFVEPNTASMDQPAQYMDAPFNAKFIWQTRCEDVSKNTYQVVFRAVDNYFNESSGLADLKAVNIRVVAPAPENLISSSENKAIKLYWDSPYTCEQTDNDFFRGFSIWRKRSATQYEPDTCSPGLSKSVYKKIAFNVATLESDKYIYLDNDIEKGVTYCYRVQADFSLKTELGFPYNLVESLPSEEVCDQTLLDIPLLLNVDVQKTDISGNVFLRWMKPNLLDFDTIKNPGPYKYQLQRANSISGEDFTDLSGTEVITPFMDIEIDTQFIDTEINTIQRGYNYRVTMYVNGDFDNIYDVSPTSSSIYVTSVGKDRQINLNWNSNTSWTNHLYKIYQSEKLNGNYTLIDSTEHTNLLIKNLTNGKLYCHYIESYGDYQSDQLPHPLLNKSNISCTEPIDSIPPCEPIFNVSNLCDKADKNVAEEEFQNLVQWKDISLTCENSDDAIGYKIYFKQNEMGELQFIEFIEGTENTKFTHKPEDGLLACYFVTAIDSFGNESPIGEPVCIEDCPSYILPNTFTPNGDSYNDIFKPILNRFIKRIDIKIFNERGVRVFETTNPEIQWNGTDMNDKILPNGVYYYTCITYKIDLIGNEKVFEKLSGYIELLK